MRPSKIPNAPGYDTVFLFGAVWNAVIERSWRVTLLCVAMALVIWLVKRWQS